MSAQSLKLVEEDVFKKPYGYAIYHDFKTSFILSYKWVDLGNREQGF